MSQEEFLLKWNDHHASFFTIVEDLCRSELLCDVTLACGGQVFETHKLMLCVCSPYFRALLTARPDKHPIVYLKDVNPKHLEQLLSYMYRGEINVLQDDLGPLIETARGLQIKGLADAGGSGSDKSRQNSSKENNKTSSNGDTRPSQTPSSKRSRTSTPTPTPSKAPRIDNNVADKSFRIGQVTVEPPTPTVAVYQEEEVDDDDGIVEVDPRDGAVKQELWIANTGEDDDEEYDIPNEQYEQELQAEDEQYIQAGAETQGQQDSLAKGKPRKALNYQCSECSKFFPSQWKLERHFVVHTGMRPFICPYCKRSHTQVDNLKIHIKKMHPTEPVPTSEEMEISQVKRESAQDATAQKKSEDGIKVKTKKSKKLAKDKHKEAKSRENKRSERGENRGRAKSDKDKMKKERKGSDGQDTLKGSGVCPVCAKTVSARNLKRHMEDIHCPGVFPCPHCGKVFSSRNKLSSHVTQTCQHGNTRSRKYQ